MPGITRNTSSGGDPIPEGTAGVQALGDPARIATRISNLMSDTATFDPAAWRSHTSLPGISGLDLPARVGGAAWDACIMVDMYRRCGRLDVELRDLAGAGHARMLCLSRSRKFDGLLGDVVRGRAFCAIAITEPETGSDLHALQTTAMPGEGGYRLSGVKQHVSRLNECSHVIVLAAVGRPDPRITAFVLPLNTDGLRVEEMPAMGMNTLSWGRLHLDDVFVDSTHRLGGEGEGIALFLKHFSYWRVMMAAVAAGSAQAAVDSAIQRMKSRKAFGGPIGRFSHLQLGLAQHAARLRMAWLLVSDTAARLDNRDPAIADAAMVKAEAVEISTAAVEWAMNVFGAAGYDSSTGLEKRYRDLAGLRLADGTTDVLRGQVARSMLGDRLYEESLGRDDGEGELSDVPRRLFW